MTGSLFHLIVCSLPLCPPQPGTQESGIPTTLPEKQGAGMVESLSTLYLYPAASGHPALSQALYSPFVPLCVWLGQWRGDF